MDADQPLKVLFRLRAADLLALTGDRGARVLSTRVVELPAARRSVDTVLRLRRGRDVFMRHLEFQARAERGLALRVFEYATRLVVHYRLPVLTTVLFLKPPAPSSLAFRESIGGRVVHSRSFDVIRLWELDPQQMLRLGPGTAALVGPMRRTRLALVGRAARCILRKAPKEQRGDLLAILQGLSEGRYTARQLARVIPREGVMASGLFATARRLARAEGRKEGRAEGRAELAIALRRSLAVLIRRLHPTVATRLAATVEQCEDVVALESWVVAASERSSDELVALVTAPAPRRTPPWRRGATTSKPIALKPVARKRAARPARRSANAPRSTKATTQR